jgi:putative flippase GtrA
MAWQGLLWKVVRASATAGAVAVINFSLIWLFAHFLSPSAAFTLAFVLALASHFALSKLFTFFDFSRRIGYQLPRYLLTAAVSYLIQFSIFHLTLRFVTPKIMIASAIAMPAGMLVSFSMLNLWVFAQPRPHSTSDAG